MTQKIARYSISNGLAGCYMPDSQNGPYFFTTRKEFAAFIRGEIAQMDWPACEIKQANLRNVWKFIQRNGSSVAHFRIQRGAYEIAFHGLTEAEFDEMEKANDF